MTQELIGHFLLECREAWPVRGQGRPHEHFYFKVGKEKGLTDGQGLFLDWLPGALETASLQRNGLIHGEVTASGCASHGCQAPCTWEHGSCCGLITLAGGQVRSQESPGTHRTGEARP